MADRPLSDHSARKAARWIKDNFSAELDGATAGKPFSSNLLCAIACQESALYWLPYINDIPPDQILGMCVLDASGDDPTSPRLAFPRNTVQFREEFGDDFTEMLISEANKFRVVRGLKPARIVYKGYGIFQFDLQYVRPHPQFFRERRWYSFTSCAENVIQELDEKYRDSGGDLGAAIESYNGSGPRARSYRENVEYYQELFEH